MEDDLTGLKTQDLAFCVPELPNNKQHIASYKSPDKLYIATSVSRLLNNVGKIFRGKFADNPKHGAQMERKTKWQIWEQVKHQNYGDELSGGNLSKGISFLLLCRFYAF